jgi:CHAT domain-containing protein
MLYLLDQDDTAQAFSLMEASRARLLMDLLAAGQQIELSDPRKQKLHSELRGLRAQISDLRQRYDRTLRLKDATPSGEREFAEIGRLDARQCELLEQIRNEAPELLEITTAGTVALDEIQQLATREKFDLLEYVVFGDQIVAWHIGPSGVHVRGIFLPRAQLLEKIEALNRTLVDPHVRFDARLARQFYLFLIEPLEEFVSTQQLVVVPHDELYFLSFQVLQDPSDGHYLTDKYQISYAPSARVLKQMGRVASLEGASALAVAAPSVLKSQAEAEAVARLLPRSKVVLPNSATKVLVKRFCAGYEVLHLSAHGEFNRNDPLLSFVQLAPQPDDDGKLTAGGMAALPLMNTRLVTLSACETGRVSETVAGEMLGMPRSLIFAGAKSVLLTRWKVDPEGTNRWMARFYTDASRASLPNAARKASADLKSDPQFAHPYFWGPFVLVGR